MMEKHGVKRRTELRLHRISRLMMVLKACI